MLYDRARIEVRAGAGGDGSAGFRREAHVPRGGPDGGDGARGGDVVLVCDDSLRDLQSFRRKPHYRAGRGGNGGGSLRHGADGETLLVRVPPGTVVEGVEGDVAGRRWDLVSAGQRAVVAKGGSGGRGNKRFATPTRQAPRFAERGLSGEEGWLTLQLKLLADVGLVGLPNAGKSSLLACLTRATPKVASYPFTTLSPVLGVLDTPFGAYGAEERQLVIADIPGLIEGASDGAGLGHDFLAHVERTRLLVHVLDLAPELTGELDPEHPADAVANHATIEHELVAHDERLARLPRVLALSKADLVSPERAGEAVEEWSRRLGPNVPVIATSSATGAGLTELAAELLRLVPAGDQAGGRVGPDLEDGRGTDPDGGLGAGAGAEVSATEQGSALGSAGARSADTDELALAEHMVFRPAASTGFTVECLAPGSFAVTGRGVERLLARYDIDNEDAMAYLEGRLRKIGVLRALEAEGFQAGDELEIAGVAFELDPEEAG
jgi:GTP-binding protein